MWIMIAGTNSSDAKSDAEKAQNLRAFNEAALAVSDKGNAPIIGVNLASPIIECAGTDREAERFQQRGLTVYSHLDEVPTVIAGKVVSNRDHRSIAHNQATLE